MPGEMANLDGDTLKNHDTVDSSLHVEEPDAELPVNNDRDAPSANAKKRLEREQTVQFLISEAKSTGAIILELNELGIGAIPDELLDLTQLQVMNIYLHSLL